MFTKCDRLFIRVDLTKPLVVSDWPVSTASAAVMHELINPTGQQYNGTLQ